MKQERRLQPANPAPPHGPTLVLTETRRREDLILAVADVILACAAADITR